MTNNFKVGDYISFIFDKVKYVGMIDFIPSDKDRIRIYSIGFYYWINKNELIKSSYEDFVKFNN